MSGAKSVPSEFWRLAANQTVHVDAITPPSRNRRCSGPELRSGYLLHARLSMLDTRDSMKNSKRRQREIVQL